MNTQAIRTSFLETLPSGSKGPVTASRHRRNAVFYALIFALGLLPTVMHWPVFLQAAGIGLLVPGAGFLADGGWLAVLFPLTLGLFWMSIVVWFWCGMVIAPLGVWLGSAALAGALVGDQVWPPSVYFAPAAAALIFIYFQYKGAKRRSSDRATFKARQGFFAESLAEVRSIATIEPVPGERELTPDQLAALRYVLDRALQPLDQFKGFTIIDQYQPAALRYQLNHLGFALGMAQGHYTPNFHGYLSEAQRKLIEKYRLPRVWDYWVSESMWGHFNFTRHDPVIRDNIMLSGWFGMHVGQFTMNSGDKRYGEPGSLTFKLNDRKVYPHDQHSMVSAVARNFERNPFTLFPCEPNWVYPICNMYGMSSLASHDAAYGTSYAATALPKWLGMLEQEFTDLKGSIVGLRSKWTGLEMPFYNGEAGFAFFANIFSPQLAQRLWAVGRKELGFCLTKDASGVTRLTLPKDLLPFLDKIDPGHYKPGLLFAYAAIMMSAREFGDDELADAAQRSMDQDCGRTVTNGALFYEKGSGQANAWAVEGKLMRTGDFRNSFIKGPPASALAGPMLEDAKYPDVLVAKAFSRGSDLELVLYPGANEEIQEIGIERLGVNQAYTISGATVDRIVSGSDGRARLQVRLSGRTCVQINPVPMK